MANTYFESRVLQISESPSSIQKAVFCSLPVCGGGERPDPRPASSGSCERNLERSRAPKSKAAPQRGGERVPLLPGEGLEGAAGRATSGPETRRVSRQKGGVYT